MFAKDSGYLGVRFENDRHLLFEIEGLFKDSGRGVVDCQHQKAHVDMVHRSKEITELGPAVVEIEVSSR